MNTNRRGGISLSIKNSKAYNVPINEPFCFMRTSSENGKRSVRDIVTITPAAKAREKEINFLFTFFMNNIIIPPRMVDNPARVDNNNGNAQELFKTIPPKITLIIYILFY